MKKFILIITSIFIFSFSASAQDSLMKADPYLTEAIFSIQDQKYEQALTLLDSSIKLNPKDYVPHYHKAYCYYLMGNKTKALEVIEKTTSNFPECDASCYQLQGNLYDHLENPTSAMVTYQMGLQKYPNSGVLHLETGILYASRNKDFSKAVYHWEQGVEKDPSFPSNYYWLSRVYCNSKNDKVWGLIYGEIFLNLEPKTQRTAEISKLIYDTYASSIVIQKKKVTLSFSPLPATEENLTNFPALYQYVMLKTIQPLVKKKKVKTISIESLTLIRDQFNEYWHEHLYHEKFPNALLKWQQDLRMDNQFTNYSYWVLKKGNDEEFMNWLKENKESFAEFAYAFLKNPMKVDGENRFYRGQYK